MRNTYRRLFAFSLIRLIDQGKHTRLTMTEVSALCSERKIIDRLRNEFPQEFNEISDQEQNALILDALDGYSNASTASDYGIENSGICLLADWLISSIGDNVEDELPEAKDELHRGANVTPIENPPIPGNLKPSDISIPSPHDVPFDSVPPEEIPEDIQNNIGIPRKTIIIPPGE